MENVMTNGFVELFANEMEAIDGGVSWNDVGLYIAGAGGASIGMKIGTPAGPIGIAAGTIIGGAVGIIIYSLWD